jgi:UDP-glucuronate 4-epimerase
MQRDFTYIDDVVEGIVRILGKQAAPDAAYNFAKPDPSSSSAPYRIYNIGNHQPVELLTYIKVIEKALGKKAIKNMLPMQSGEVLTTCADIDDLRAAVGFAPSTPLVVGVAKFVAWYLQYYGDNRANSGKTI